MRRWIRHRLQCAVGRKEPSLRVLVADDEPDHRFLARLALEASGHEVLEAEDGATALEQASAARPDVILLDTMLPDQPGSRIIEELQKQQETSGIPVIGYTARLDRPALTKLLAAGAVCYVGKPFRAEQLCSLVERVHDMSPPERRRFAQEQMDAL